MDRMRGFEERYQTGNTPWDHGIPDYNLTGLVESFPIAPCNVLDIGCGTGNNAIWLARRNFAVTGCDLSKTAIERARKKAQATGLDCCFLVADFLTDRIPNPPFGFVFDRGCLHSVKDAAERSGFSENVASCLEEGGLWLTITGNADEPTREIGPPQLTAAELIVAVEPCFEIISLTSGHFGSDQDNPPQAWICLLRKRKA